MDNSEEILKAGQLQPEHKTHVAIVTRHTPEVSLIRTPFLPPKVNYT